MDGWLVGWLVVYAEIGKHHNSCKARTHTWLQWKSETLAGKQNDKRIARTHTVENGEGKKGDCLKFATPKLRHEMIARHKTQRQRHEIRFVWDKTIARNAYIKWNIFFSSHFYLAMARLNILSRNYATNIDETARRQTERERTARERVREMKHCPSMREQKNFEKTKIRIRIDLFSFRLRLTLHFGAVLHVLV